MATTSHQRIRQLADQLQNDPDISERLSQVADLAEERQQTQKADRLARGLVKIAKATSEAVEEEGPLSPEDRARMTKAVSPSQLAYLREVSPRAAEAFERSRA